MVAEFQVKQIYKGRLEMTKGVICLAQNNSTTDYVRLAYLQRLSLRLTNPELPYAIVTDQSSLSSMTEKIKKQFDHIIVLPTDWAQDQEWKQRNDWQLFNLTPFTQTIKLEADLLLTNSIAHWWPMLEHRDMVISLGCRDYQGRPNISRAYRRVFDINTLPDIYSGLMYWKKCKLASNFFSTCRSLYLDWENVKVKFQQCNDLGSNDMIFAVASLIVGIDNVTLPAADFFQFIHFKPEINGMSPVWPCTQQCTIHTHAPSITINGRRLEYPFHYYDKDFASQERIREYEHAVGI